MYPYEWYAVGIIFINMLRDFLHLSNKYKIWTSIIQSNYFNTNMLYASMHVLHVQLCIILEL